MFFPANFLVITEEAQSNTKTFIRNTQIQQHKIETKKQTGLVASYDLRPGKGAGLNLHLPGPTLGASVMQLEELCRAP